MPLVNNLRRKVSGKRRAVAQAVIVFLLMIILVGGLYIPLNMAFQSYQSIQVQLWSNNVFDADSLTFVNEYWITFPVFVFFISIGYLYLKAQKRGGYGD